MYSERGKRPSRSRHGTFTVPFSIVPTICGCQSLKKCISARSLDNAALLLDVYLSPTPFKDSFGVTDVRRHIVQKLI